MSEMSFRGNVIDDVCGLTRNQRVVALAKEHDLDVVNVMWEDTARTPGSCWGANITDMTLQVRHPGGSDKRSLLPVFRPPNFRDKTCDVDLDRAYVKVGNEKGAELAVVKLRELLGNLARHLSDSKTLGEGSAISLVTESDTHILVSAQACLLPIPSGESAEVEFNPVLFNYQSRAGSPAVLTIMCSPEGTSVTALDNEHERAEWGQNVYFNNAGQKSPLTGQRLSTFVQARAKEIVQRDQISEEEALAQVTVSNDINVVVIFQVPLKYEKAKYRKSPILFACGSMDMEEMTEIGNSSRGRADFEDAVIGHGADEGKHFECGGLKIERDPDFPIRATVQFYKVTDSPNIDRDQVAQMAACIERVFSDGEFVGSLVDGSLQFGELGMGQARPTQPAPQLDSVQGPPVDYLDSVSPFSKDNNPKA